VGGVAGLARPPYVPGVSRDNVQTVRRAAVAVFRTPQAADAWLTLRSRHLGVTPLACTRAGHGDLVLAILRLVARNEAPDPRFSPPPRSLRARLRALWTWRRPRVRLPALTASEPGTARTCPTSPRAPR
jgi:hypothetical protein